MSLSTGFPCKAFSLSTSFLNWQPVVDLESGKPFGAEALLRSPDGGPAEMLDWIERKDCWEEFTQWEMERIVSELSLLPPLPGPFYAFLNLSPRQCVASYIFPWLAHFPVRIVPVLEILEESLDPAHLSVLAEARRRGFRLAVDDFGTGHSNVSRLLDLSVDFVKIDRRLIQATEVADRDLVEGIGRAIVRTGISVLGEGLETEEQVWFAGRIGCASGQGWYFGKPVSIEELAGTLSGTARRGMD